MARKTERIVIITARSNKRMAVLLKGAVWVEGDNQAKSLDSPFLGEPIEVDFMNCSNFETS